MTNAHVRWLDDRTVAVGDVVLTVTYDPAELKGFDLQTGGLVLCKPRALVDAIAAFAPVDVAISSSSAS